MNGFNLQEILLAGIDGHFGAEAAQNSNIEALAPIPEPDRAVAVAASFIPGVANGTLFLVAGGLLAVYVVMAAQ